MKISKAISHIDEIEPNTYTTPVKIEWLSQVDGLIARQTIVADGGEAPDTRYTEDMTENELLVPYPYDSIYEYYLGLKIALANKDYEVYNNLASLYDGALKDYLTEWRRTHSHSSQFKLK